MASRSVSVLHERDWFTDLGRAFVQGCKEVGAAIAKVASAVFDAAVVLAEQIAEIVGVLVDTLLALVTPGVNGVIAWHWEPPRVFHSPWEMQARLFRTEKGGHAFCVPSLASPDPF